MPTRRPLVFVFLILSIVGAVPLIRAADERLERYLKEVRKQFGLVRTDSGLLFMVMEAGKGARPTPGDSVVVTLAAMGPDVKTPLKALSGEKIRVKITDLLPGLTEGLQMMTVNTRALMILAPDLSFGTGRWPEGLEPGTPISFLVTLHEVIPPQGTP